MVNSMWLLNLNHRHRFKMAVIYAIAFHSLLMAIFLKPFEKPLKASLSLSQKKTIMRVSYQVLDKVEATAASSTANNRTKAPKTIVASAKSTVKTPSKTAAVQKKEASSKKSIASNSAPKKDKKKADALTVLKESQARLSSETQQQQTTSSPKQEVVPIQLQSSSVNFDRGANLSNHELNYQSRIRETLYSQLKIPKGKVAKCRLKIDREGKLIQAEILESPTNLYREFLMKELSKISFPPFDKSLTQQDYYTIIVTLFA